MLGIVIGVVVLVVIFACLAAAALLIPRKRRDSLVPAYSMAPLQIRASHDVETDEDLAVIAEVYREQRRADRAAQALERLARITPAASANK